MTTREAALNYASRGWRVFPTHSRNGDGCTCRKDDCSSPAKHPLTRQGLTEATTDADTIAGWWSRWPYANVAIATGADSGIVVLDVDTDKGGRESLKELDDDVGGLPTTLTSRTGGGGLHMIYCHPGHPVKTRARAFGNGLDTRGDGGYIIAPPSQHISGRDYSWADEDVLIADWPESLDDRLAQRAIAVPATVLPLRRIDGDGTRYGVAALQNLVDELAGEPEGGRNHTLNRVTWRAAQLIAAGQLAEAPTLDIIRATAADVGLSRVETERTMRSAYDAGIRQPATVPERPPPIRTAAPAEVVDLQKYADARAAEEPPDDDDYPEPGSADPHWTVSPEDLWDARPVYGQIRDFARGRLASPWATLGVVLARVVAAVPPYLRLPAIIGGEASLNLYIGIVGKSGEGKGAATAVAADLLDVDVEELPLGSGEAIAHAYMRQGGTGKNRYVEQHNERVLFHAHEIDTVAAISDRRGSTLLAQLRSAWMGERLGFHYVDPAKRLPVPGHAYRLCLVAGIQPDRAGALLDDSDGGTPQRFLWLPARDPHAGFGVPCPPAIHWRLGPVPGVREGVALMDVCQTARDTITSAHLARTRGEGDALDGHALLCRLKVASAMALLDGREDVNDEDWMLSGLVMAKSDETRAGVVSALRASFAEANYAKAKGEAARATVVEETLQDAAVKRTSRAILRTLMRAREGFTGAQLRRTIAGRDRQYFEDAIWRLTDTRRVVVERVERPEGEHGGGDGVRYRIGDGR